MEIKLDRFVTINNLEDYKIHFAVWNGNEQPLDVFVRDKDEWKGWNSSRRKKDDFSRKYIFSLIRYYHRVDKWLFGGIFEVISRKSDSYVVNLDDRYNEFIGRLLLHYSGPGTRGRAFYLEKHYSELTVSALFERSYSGEAFCGYENIAHGFLQLESIFRQNKQDWKVALENSKGVYLIVDKSNGKKYVGSAYGEQGIWARWSCYIGTGHGWNDELTKLIKEKGMGYARKNFQISILEYYPMRTDDQYIINREQYWKRALVTNTFGYNKN